MEGARFVAGKLRETLWGDKPVRLTLEPFIFLLWFGHTIVYGAGIGVDLLILKVCHYELGFNRTVCDNLRSPENDDAEAQVQVMVNNFEMVRDWIYNAPPVFFSLVAGGLSDRFGRKPLIVFPVIGFFLRTCSSIFLYTFLEWVPLEAFILEEIDTFFGGLGVFFLGVYGFGSTITDESDRAGTLVRYDGVETLAQILGTALSPFIFGWLGFYGSYFFRAGFTLVALFYLVVVIKEPLKKEQEHTSEEEDVKESNSVDRPCYLRLPWLVHDYVIRPAWETLRTLFRPRKGHLRTIIFVQLFIYGCYKFSNANFTLTYLYMKRVFDAEQHHYALLKSVLKGLQCACLLLVVPVFIRRGVHETIVCGVTVLISGLALLLSALAWDVWSFIAARWILAFRECQYGPGRALLTRSCEEDEIAKVLAGASIVSFAVPYVALPAMRQLYNANIDTSAPFAYILLAAAVTALASALNFALFTQRSKFRSAAAVASEKELDGEAKEGGEELKVV